MKNPSPAELTSLTDPVHFAGDILKSSLWRKQRDIMRAVATKPLVAVKACHASGKTYQAARFALWWLLRYPEGKVINTAPSWRQVKLMWEEIRLARRDSRIIFPVPNATELRISDTTLRSTSRTRASTSTCSMLATEPSTTNASPTQKQKRIGVCVNGCSEVPSAA